METLRKKKNKKLGYLGLKSLELVIFRQICGASASVFMVLVRYRLFCTWGQSSNNPAVLFAAYSSLSFVQSQQPEPGSPAQGWEAL